MTASTLKNKTIAQLRTLVFKLQASTMNPKSKWYKADCADLKKHNATRSKAQLIETICRLSYVPTEKEMNENCQFDGLPRMGR